MRIFLAAPIAQCPIRAAALARARRRILARGWSIADSVREADAILALDDGEAGRVGLEVDLRRKGNRPLLFWQPGESIDEILERIEEWRKR